MGLLCGRRSARVEAQAAAEAAAEAQAQAEAQAKAQAKKDRAERKRKRKEHKKHPKLTDEEQKKRQAAKRAEDQRKKEEAIREKELHDQQAEAELLAKGLGVPLEEDKYTADELFELLQLHCGTQHAFTRCDKPAIREEGPEGPVEQDAVPGGGDWVIVAKELREYCTTDTIEPYNEIGQCIEVFQLSAFEETPTEDVLFPCTYSFRFTQRHAPSGFTSTTWDVGFEYPAPGEVAFRVRHGRHRDQLLPLAGMPQDHGSVGTSDSSTTQITFRSRDMSSAEGHDDAGL